MFTSACMYLSNQIGEPSCSGLHSCSGERASGQAKGERVYLLPLSLPDTSKQANGGFLIWILVDKSVVHVRLRVVGVGRLIWRSGYNKYCYSRRI